MSKYIHLLDGKPAHFVEDQIYFARQGTPLKELLVDSLRQIRREQQTSIAFRFSMYGELAGDSKYGYLRVTV